MDREKNARERETQEMHGRRATSVVFEREVVVVGDLRSQAEYEVLSVSHLIFVHRTDCFDDLKCTQEKRESERQKRCFTIGPFPRTLQIENTPDGNTSPIDFRKGFYWH